MRDKTVQDVMAVLPDRFGDDERCVDRDFPEHFHPIFLAVDETVLFFGIEGVGTL